jgi:hypothetical protein
LADDPAIFSNLSRPANYRPGKRAPRPAARPTMHTPDLSGQSPSRSDEVALRLDDENIHFSQRAGAFEELCLGETLEAAHLRKLLRDAGGDGQSVLFRSAPRSSQAVAHPDGARNPKKSHRRPARKAENDSVAIATYLSSLALNPCGIQKSSDFPKGSIARFTMRPFGTPQARISAAGGLHTIFKNVIKVSCFVTVEGICPDRL